MSLTDDIVREKFWGDCFFVLFLCFLNSHLSVCPISQSEYCSCNLTMTFCSIFIFGIDSNKKMILFCMTKGKKCRNLK